MLNGLRLTGLFCLWIFGCLASSVVAEEPVLIVSGPDTERAFSLDDLRAMEQETFETTTIWTEGVQVFTGVPLSALVSQFGITEGELIATAINEYAISFPVEDALKEGPIVAFLRNGNEMSIRDKGPLWIVYPYDSSEEYQSEVVHARSIWQLYRITFKAD
jgi:hypothetical protein